MDGPTEGNAGSRVARRRRGRHRVIAAFVVVAACGYAVPGLAAICPLPTIPIAPASGGQPPSIQANQVELKNKVVRARGDVRLTRNEKALEAPFVKYNRETGEATARGGLSFYKPGLFFSARRGNIDVDDDSSSFRDVKYVLMTSAARGRAEAVVSKTEGILRLDGATYTTCPLNSPAWYLSATDVTLNRETGRGEAWNTVLHLYDVPVFYSPYFNFPIDDRRHTGFLAPVIGYTSSSGFVLTLPFYVNLAPNYDLTLFPRFYGERGFQLGAQGRYLFAHHRGGIAGQYMPYDRAFDDSRSFVHFEHIGQINEYIGIEAVYNRASDDTYFDDLTAAPDGTSTSILERGAQLSFAATGARLNVLVQDFQELYERFNPDLYTRLPRVELTLASPTAPFRIGLNASFTNFVSDNLSAVEGKRYDVEPRLIWSTDHGAWFARSELSYRFTHYSLDNVDRPSVANRPTSIDRGIPSFELATGLRFVRTATNGWIQTLTPKIQYLYTGYENQRDIPIFDSGVPDLSYTRLFADNRFTGIDRIGDANQITLGANTRLYSPQSGRTLFKASLGRIFSFRDLKVGVPRSAITGYSNDGSDYVGSLMVSPIPEIRARGSIAYNVDRTRVDRASATFLYATSAGYGVSLGYRYYRGYRPAFGRAEFDTLKQVALGAFAPLGDRFELVTRWSYSLAAEKDIETLVGVQYSPSCCIAARVSWRRYVTDRSGDYDSAIMFQLALRGLAELGQTAESFVQDDIFSGIAAGPIDQSFNTLQIE